MKTSPAGIAAIESREGKRYAAYLDSNGVPTVGTGHTGRMAPPAVHLGMTITEAECAAFLAADLAPVEKAINALGVKLTQNQFDACASLAFNIGLSTDPKHPGFPISTVAKRLSSGDYASAADAFLLWEKPAVLKTRREGERRQFLTPDKQPVPVSAAAPAPAKPAPAPVAAAPAHPGPSVLPATKKEAPMTTAAPATAAAAKSTASVNVIAGLANVFETVVSGIEASIKTATSSVTSGAVNAATNGSAIVSSVSDGEAAIADIKKAIADAKGGAWGNEPSDVIDFLKHVFAILARFGVNVPVVSAIVSALPGLPAVA